VTGVRRDCTCPRFKHEHGTYNAYEYDKCRCFKCCLAWSQAKERYRTEGSYGSTAGLVARTGTDRRIEALLAIGWRHSDISDRLTLILGRHANSGLIHKHPGKLTYAQTAAAVAAVYDELSCQQGPSQRNRNRAAKAGYVVPFAWDDIDNDPGPAEATETVPVVDEIAVELAMSGHPVHLTREEKREAWRRLKAAGLSARVIGQRLNVSTRSVQRRRAA
jgi:hypothetical protein